MDPKGFLLVLTLFCLSSSARAAKCVPKKATAMIDWANFRGVWYEYQSFGDGLHRIFGRCMKDAYVTRDDSTSYREHTYKTRVIPLPFSSKNTLKVTSPSSFTLQSNGMFSSDVHLTLLDTDNVNYAILWSCKDGFFSVSESSWILTRSREPTFTPEVEAKLKSSLEKFGLSLDLYGEVKQNSCD